MCVLTSVLFLTCRLPFISTMILVIIVAEGDNGDHTLDEAFYLGDGQVIMLNPLTRISQFFGVVFLCTKIA